ncbi:hypothetical protein M011DRAFT_467148 [Sporormia fimetaria CBS 119925]|uniref:Uncharacterized protein n=1 Tax=Sporormia fimetaria CBS 119925 TaxID=1340428 RepID=A0A6A6VC14_9PLEO|nr:hypothetical protein M011DRAFT_467148 [Sporormia fimetaria CBS 119925]
MSGASSPKIAAMGASPRISGTSTPVEGHKKDNKNLWHQLKHAVVEHHRSVNNAYQACYGGGRN